MSDLQKTLETDAMYGDWGADDEKPMDSISLQEFEAICKEVFDRRTALDEAREVLKLQDEELSKLERKVLSYLTHFKKDKHHVTGLGTIGIINRKSVKVPQDATEKQAFFKWLQEKGIFWDYTTVNSQKLNSLYKAEYEIAGEEGRLADFKIPGVGAPTVFQSISVRKGK